MVCQAVENEHVYDFDNLLLRVRQSSDSYRCSLQRREPENEFEGKLMDVDHPLAHGVMASIFIW